jgi:hypothetical protein
MSASSNFLEIKLLDHVLRNSAAAFDPENTVYVGLFSNSGGGAASALESGTNSTSGTGNWGHYEINNGSYARQSVTFAAAASSGTGTSTAGTISSNATVTFPVATANYDSAGSQGQTVTHIAILDASTGGNVYFYGALTTSKTVSSGDQFTVSSGNLTVSLA